jgi:hypothetical protein
MSHLFDIEAGEVGCMIGRVFSTVMLDSERQRLIFNLPDGSRFVMCHEQDCCEEVYIDDIDGCLSDLVGTPIIEAYASSSDKNPKIPDDEDDGSFTWTFYKFRTLKGYVAIRWYGTSNGYYSETANIWFYANTKEALQ